MWIARLLSNIGYCIADLLIAVARCIVWLAILAASAPALLVLSAQAYRWYEKGQWRSVSLMELLQIFELRPAHSGSGVSGAGEVLLALPGPFALALVAVALLVVDRLLRRLEIGRHHLLLRSRQRSIIHDIEHALSRPKDESILR